MERYEKDSHQNQDPGKRHVPDIPNSLKVSQKFIYFTKVGLSWTTATFWNRRQFNNGKKYPFQLYKISFQLLWIHNSSSDKKNLIELQDNSIESKVLMTDQ